MEAEWFCSPSSRAPACTRTFSQARVHAPPAPFLCGQGSRDPPSPFPSPSLSSVPDPLHAPGQPLGSQFCNNAWLRPSEYHSLQSDRRMLPKNPTVSLPFSKTSVECSLPFSNLLPTSLIKLTSCSLHSLHSSHILNLEAKFTDFGSGSLRSNPGSITGPLWDLGKFLNFHLRVSCTSVNGTTNRISCTESL